MSCTLSCPCQCGQLACSCRRAAAAAMSAQRVDDRPTAKCQACGTLALMQSVRSSSGKVVVVILCPACDTVMGKAKR